MSAALTNGISREGFVEILHENGLEEYSSMLVQNMGNVTSDDEQLFLNATEDMKPVHRR